MSDLLEKLNKSEFIMGMLASILGFAASKIGLSHDDLVAVLTFLGGLSTAYISGRSYAKPREMQSAGGAAPASPLPPAV